MFCKKCGSPLADDAAFCGNCGARVEAVAAANNNPSVTPVAVENNGPGIMEVIGKFVKDYWLYILSGVSSMTFVWGILNLFCVFYPLDKYTNTHVPLSDLEGSTGIVMVYIGNILFGLICLGAAGIGILCFLEKLKNKPIYDQFFGSKLHFRPALVIGALGAAGVLTQITFYLFCVDAGVNWTTWLMLFIFAGVVVYDKLVLEKKEQAEEPAV